MKHKYAELTNSQPLDHDMVYPSQFLEKHTEDYHRKCLASDTHQRHLINQNLQSTKGTKLNFLVINLERRKDVTNYTVDLCNLPPST